MSRYSPDQGLSLIEVMVAMMIAGIAFLGTMGAVEISSRHVKQAGLGSRALELAQSRLEIKRSVRWKLLLEDDLDDDGIAETVMRDDGQEHDAMAGDGIFTAVLERDGVTVVWSVEADRPGPLSSAGLVAVRAIATYHGVDGPKEIRVATLRANPAFVGPQ